MSHNIEIVVKIIIVKYPLNFWQIRQWFGEVTILYGNFLFTLCLVGSISFFGLIFFKFFSVYIKIYNKSASWVHMSKFLSCTTSSFANVNNVCDIYVRTFGLNGIWVKTIHYKVTIIICLLTSLSLCWGEIIFQTNFIFLILEWGFNNIRFMFENIRGIKLKMIKL
jgi:hypothetical protein